MKAAGEGALRETKRAACLPAGSGASPVVSCFYLREGKFS